MSIDVTHADIVEVGYDEFCGALAAHDLKALWSLQRQLMPDVPVPTTLPWLWKWATIFPLARRAGEIVTIERGGDRRVLALANPGLQGMPYTSTTLWGAIQYLGPGETAPAHRHTPSAIRFVMVGSGVYTTVDGDACQMEPGDLILTPRWKWHDHNNEGDEEMVWFDGLDLPLLATLESVFFENHPDHTQPILGRNLSQQRFASGGIGEARARAARGDSPLLRYPWSEADRALESLHQRRGGPIVTIEYLDPLTGGPALATFACQLSRLYPGERTRANRKTGSSVFVVFRGSGRSIIDGVAFDWGPGDIFVTPSWAVVDHEAWAVADLFQITDRPVLEALHLFREETTHNAQPVLDVFVSRSRAAADPP